ncbi:uncharacterized protein LOC113512854 [Galleria mellonella]|uniref:Uncharacterized protein LOC113512854 n=1 Tax=Galleria mellonella TaxID=7137 RepID=A0A6J1WGC0_GALME|nr:uncharacterized protein LOC113512854 [Galleria mellonella]
MSATVETSLKDKIRNAVEIPILTRCCFCFPMRKGLVAFAYINLTLTVVATTFLSLYITAVRNANVKELNSEYPRLIIATTAQVIEICMTIMFIVALHKKYVVLMRVFLYFEITYSVVGLVYSLVCISEESANELFLMLFEFTLQIYLAILIYSSIVKMERDGTVKYTRDRDPV